MQHCILCGTGNDITAQYCEGFGCGADLAGQRHGDPSRAVQVEADPEEAVARPGDLVETLLTIRNAGSEPDKYVLEMPREIGDRVTVERHGSPGEVPPDGTCSWTVRYAVPQDWDPTGHLVGVGGLFGTVGADDPAEARGDGAIEVPLRVVSAQDRRVAAGAFLTVLPLAVPGLEPGRTAVGASRAAKRESRRTQFAAGGAVAAVAIVAALIVGMAAAGSGGGGDKDPTRKAVTTSSLPGIVATEEEGAQSVPTTDVPSTEATTSSPPRTSRTTKSPGRTSKPPASGAPSTAPGPGAPPPPPPPPPPSTSEPAPTSAPTTGQPGTPPATTPTGSSPGLPTSLPTKPTRSKPG